MENIVKISGNKIYCGPECELDGNNVINPEVSSEITEKLKQELSDKERYIERLLKKAKDFETDVLEIEQRFIDEQTEYKEQLKFSKEKLYSLKSDFIRTQKENEKLTGKIDEYQKQIEKMFTQINELQKVNVDMLSSINILEKANDTYEEEIERLKTSGNSTLVRENAILGIDEDSRTEEDKGADFGYQGWGTSAGQQSYAGYGTPTAAAAPGSYQGWGAPAPAPQGPPPPPHQWGSNYGGPPPPHQQQGYGQYGEYEESVKFTSNIMDDIQKTLKTIIKENAALKKEQKHLKARIQDLEGKLENVDHVMEREEVEQKKNNIIIVGLSGQDVNDEVQKVFRKLDINVDESQYKLQKLNSNSTTKPVLVKFNNMEIRAKVMDAKKRVKLDSAGCGIGDRLSAAMSERLTDAQNHQYVDLQEGPYAPLLTLVPKSSPYHKGEARKTGFRLWSQGSWTFMNPGKGHSTTLAELHEDSPILLARSDIVSPTHRFNRKFTVVFPSREEWESRERQLIEGGGQVWYTDGSLAREGSGSGDYGPHTRLSLPLGGHTTVFQAEVYAILACVNRIRKTDGSRRRITICSDSQAAIKALNAWKITSGLVLECRRALDDISAKHKVSLMWVPGHAGVKGNEMADHLARMGSGNSFENNWRVDPDKHSLRWNNISGHLRQARELLAGPAERIGRFCLSLDRSNLRLLVGLLTGHNTFRRHLFVTRVVNDPTCTWCGEEKESSAHILCRCETLGYHRQTMLGTRTLEPIEIKRIGPKNVLAFAKRAGFRN
ncbi:unnamed protein product [Callosobruchus maculatus]|uniref:ribonuclease H n=1 Tax=Callosobruchus maculatus TaxID=64391 RepID=A0A653DE31_CALMS|nr:unnamed protein product [Callosobruchus maculatus]